MIVAPGANPRPRHNRERLMPDPLSVMHRPLPRPSSAPLTPKYRYYPLVMAAFVTVLLCSNLIGPGKTCIVELPFSLPWLGAILTFANHALYAPHFLTTATWSLTPLADQQLAGVIMWIPAGLVLTVGLVTGLARVLKEPETRLTMCTLEYGTFDRIGTVTEPVTGSP